MVLFGKSTDISIHSLLVQMRHFVHKQKVQVTNDTLYFENLITGDFFFQTNALKKKQIRQKNSRTTSA